MDNYSQLSADITAIDEWLDTQVAEQYKEQPLAQDWARISKVVEELGEAIQAFIGFTGQNPRKGYTHRLPEVVKELYDTAATALLAVRHFQYDDEPVMANFAAHVHKLRERVNA